MCSVSVVVKVANVVIALCYWGALAMTTATARTRSLEINIGPIVTIFDCPNLFAFCIVRNVRYKWIGVRDVKSNTEN